MSIKTTSKNRMNKKHKSLDLFIEDVAADSKHNTSLQPIVDCNCNDHVGQVYLNQTFDMTFSYMFECLFEFNEFYYKFLKSQKMTEFKAEDWKIENGIKTRRTDYIIEVNNVIGGRYCKNIEYIKIVKFIENEICVIDTEALSSGIIYSDCFKICHRYCLTNCSSNKRCKLVVHSFVNYISKPNFIIKNLIDKNCVASLIEFFRIMSNNLQAECERLKLTTDPIIKTSTQIDLTESVTSSVKSSILLTSSSAKEFSSDNESSESEDLIRRPNTRNSLKTKISQHDVTNQNNQVLNFFLEKDQKIMRKRHTNSVSESNYQLHTSSKKIQVDQEPKSVNLNFKTDLFIKMFFILMMFLLVLNFVLYAKLREIEKIAITIKQHPKFNI